MSDKLPVDYRDYPRAYVGKPTRVPAEQYGDQPDMSKPDAPAGRQDANDAVNPGRPSGAATTPVMKKKKTIVWHATGH